MLLDVEQIRSLAEAILMDLDTAPMHARIQTDLLLEAEMRGLPSHGLLRLPRIAERIMNGVCVPAASGKHIWARRNFLQVDGERGLGPVVALGAIKAIRARAAEDGIAIAAISNNNHIGMLAWYVEQIAQSGLMAIAATTSEALVHPWGGRKAMLGTNPLAIAIPASPEPLVLDMATSRVAMGKIHDHANRGEPIPAGWALDAEGRPTTDANLAKNGAIAPFGGAKGYALGLALEVLVAGLTASALGTAVKGTLDSDQVCNKGDIVIIIHPEAGERSRQMITAYLDDIRACEPADPDHPVSVPGDRARRIRALSLSRGLDLDDGLWHDLQALAASLKQRKLRIQ